MNAAELLTAFREQRDAEQAERMEHGYLVEEWYIWGVRS